LLGRLCFWNRCWWRICCLQWDSLLFSFSVKASGRCSLKPRILISVIAYLSQSFQNNEELQAL
jgi:hypothetical protein